MLNPNLQMVEIGLQVLMKLWDAPLQDKEEASKGIKFFIFQLQYKSIHLEIIVKTSHVATGYMETMCSCNMPNIFVPLFTLSIVLRQLPLVPFLSHALCTGWTGPSSWQCCGHSADWSCPWWSGSLSSCICQLWQSENDNNEANQNLKHFIHVSEWMRKMQTECYCLTRNVME